MSHAISIRDHLVIVTLHPSLNFDAMLLSACANLLAALDQQPHKLILLVDIRELTVAQCNAILSERPDRVVQLMFTHPRLHEILITAPDEVYRIHAKDRMYKSYNTSPILLARSPQMALDYVAEWRSSH